MKTKRNRILIQWAIVTIVAILGFYTLTKTSDNEYHASYDGQSYTLILDLKNAARIADKRQFVMQFLNENSTNLAVVARNVSPSSQQELLQAYAQSHVDSWVGNQPGGVSKFPKEEIPEFTVQFATPKQKPQ